MKAALSRFASMIRRWFRPSSTESALTDEIHSYLQHDIDAKIRAGMNPDEARRTARIELGGIDQVKEHARQGRAGAGIDSFAQDFRYALRTLTQAAGFSLSVIGSLTLGIAAVVAAFTFINGWVFRPLPGVQRQDRLVNVEIQHKGCDFPSCWGPIATSVSDYQVLQEGLKSLDGLAASTSDQVSVRLPAARTLPATFVSENYFDVLQVRPTIGRADTATGAVIAHSLWVRDFNADPTVIGQAIYVGNERVQIVGVAPPAFVDLAIPIGRPGTALWLPMALVDLVSNSELIRNLTRRPAERYRSFVGRLKDGAQVSEVQAAATGLASQLLTARNLNPQNGRAQLSEVGRKGVDRKSSAFAFIMPIPVLVLVLACLNAANLLLARASKRNREIAIRLAIGATRWRVVRQLLIESLLLAIAAAAVAVPLAWSALRVASSYLLLPMPVDLNVVAVAILTAALSAVGFGLAPAFRVTKRQPARALGAAQSSTDGMPERTRGRRLLVVSQVTLSLALLTFGTQLYSAVKSWDQSAGTPPERLLVASFDLAQLQVSDAEARTFYSRALENISRLPGVEKVGLAHLDSLWPRRGIKGPDSPVAWLPSETSRNSALYLGGYAGGDLFEALGLRTLQGRGFHATERGTALPLVAIVNKPFADEVLSGAAVGKKVWVNARYAEESTAIQVEIVGVVEPALQPTYRGKPETAIYLPGPLSEISARALYIRTSGPADSVKAAVRNTIRQIDPRVPFVEFSTLEEINQRERLPYTGMAGAAAILGILGLILATTGLYAVVSYIMSMRSREIAIRLTLGAERGDVFRMIFRQAMTMVTIGTILGAFIAYAASQIIRSQTRGIGQLDLLAFGGSILLLLLPMVLASVIPALRATRSDPVRFLRAD
jgi:predicted permease